MTPFILVCAVMIVAAVALLAIPLARRVPVTARGQPAVPRSIVTLIVTGVALPLVAVVLYSSLSNFPWQDPGAADAASPGDTHDPGAESLARAIAQLEARLVSNPADADGWRMLGRAYLVTGQADKAVTAYEEADALLGGQDAGLQLDIAEALVLTDDPSVLGRARDIIGAALAADPGNGKALWYSGVMAMRAGDQATAKTSFQKLLEQNPPPEIRQIVIEQLAGLGVQTPASAAGGDSPMSGGGATAGPGATVASSGRTIRVSVSLDPALAARLKPGIPLFVAARQPGIPGPPLAALRLSSDQLPTTVELSDANSVIEGRNLSSADEVEIIARVAFGGTAVPEAGDLVGTATSAKGGPANVNIVINTVRP